MPLYVNLAARENLFQVILKVASCVGECAGVSTVSSVMIEVK